jgi:tetratricopeptide (TPR) repeat protein
VAIAAVALLAGSLNYFYRAERASRADRAFEAANQLYRKERFPEAIEQYRYALSISHRADHRLALGIALVKDGRMNEAAIYLNEVLRQHPNNGRAHLALAAALAATQQFDDAVLHYRKAILGAWDDDPAGNRFRARAELIDVLAKTGRAADVRAELLALVADPPAETALQKQAARLLLDHGAVREAADLYRRMIRSSPRDAAGYDGLGAALFAARDYPAAGAAYSQALSIDSADAEAARKGALVDRILALDPERRNLAPAERYRRSRDLLQRVLDRVNACGGSPETESAQAELARKGRPPSFSDAAEENLGLARRVWAKRPSACASPDDDPALLLLRASPH